MKNPFYPKIVFTKSDPKVLERYAFPRTLSKTRDTRSSAIQDVRSDKRVPSKYVLISPDGRLSDSLSTSICILPLSRGFLSFFLHWFFDEKKETEEEKRGKAEVEERRKKRVLEKKIR